LSDLPPVPQRGKDILTWAKPIQRFIRSITPRSSATVKVNRTDSGTTFEVSRLGLDTGYHFEVINDADFTPAALERRVAIRGGLWGVDHSGGYNEYEIGGGDFAGSGSGVDDLFTTATTIAAGTTAYVWLVINGTGGEGDMSQPSGLYAKIDTTRPTGATYDPRAWKILATIENDVNGELTIDPEWEGGNIDRKAMQLDGQDTLGGLGLKSLDYNSKGDYEIEEFEGASEYECPQKVGSSIAWDWIATFGGGTPGTSTGAQDFLVNAYDNSNGQLAFDTDTYNIVNGTIDISNGTAAGVTVDIWGMIDEYISNPLDPFLHGDTWATALDEEDWASNGDHDPRYWANFAKAGLDPASYHTSGNMRANDIYVQDRAANHWGNDVFDVDVTSAVNITPGVGLSINLKTDATGVVNIDGTTAAGAGTGALVCDGGGYFAAGLYAVKGGSTYAGYFTDGTYAAFLGTGSTAAGFNNGGLISVDLCTATFAMLAVGDVDVSSGDYYHESTQGITLSNWFGGGIATGTGIVEKEVQNLAPTDKVLVRA
jgi:hypothetical protein